MWKVKLHLFATFIFTLVAYIIPLSFTGYLFSSEAKQSVHTLVSEDYFGSFISGRILTLIPWKGDNHSFLSFRFCYILCLYISGLLVSMV